MSNGILKPGALPTTSRATLYSSELYAPHAILYKLVANIHQSFVFLYRSEIKDSHHLLSGSNDLHTHLYDFISYFFHPSPFLERKARRVGIIIPLCLPWLWLALKCHSRWWIYGLKGYIIYTFLLVFLWLIFQLQWTKFPN